MTLTTTRVARFVTVDASAGPRQAPVAVTTLELVGPPRARSAGGGGTARSRSAGGGRTAGSRAAGGRTARSRAAAPPPSPPRSLPHDVLVIGDSLAVGMQDALRAALPGWHVTFDARTGRPLAEGMRVLAAQHAAPAIVAFSLFTNDAPGSTAALEQAVRATAARPGGCAVWATIVRPPVDGVSYAAANRLLERLAGDPQVALGLQLVDWSAVIARTPAYLAPDGVHGTPAGYRARGELYASAIRACAGDA
jgi:lysophospholipase L1-like esterase